MTTKRNSEIIVWLIVGVIAVVIAGFILFTVLSDRRGGNGECNDNYSGTCVPNVKNDIDCDSISGAVSVVGKDVYNFDADNDSIGCESNSR